MPSAVRTQKIFATPLLVGQISNKKLNDALEKAILAKREEDPGIKRSNVGGWHSDLALQQWGGLPARNLVGEVIKLVNQHTSVLGGDPSQLRWHAEAWANVNERGSSNARHYHGGCFWSAVYYVRVGSGEGGRLVLYDPRMPTLAMHAPPLRFRDAGGEREVKIEPREGRLVVFPSWLAHEVEQWQGDELRISIAINLSSLTRVVPPSLKRVERPAKAPVIGSTETA
jgi:uncharacterized protein (TIGR02466 family)